jgi:hypothetical protein
MPRALGLSSCVTCCLVVVDLVATGFLVPWSCVPQGLYRRGLACLRVPCAEVLYAS